MPVLAFFRKDESAVFYLNTAHIRSVLFLVFVFSASILTKKKGFVRTSKNNSINLRQRTYRESYCVRDFVHTSLILKTADVPCRAAMAPWLLRHPRCPTRALQFSLCFSNKAPFGLHPLASSYNSRVTVSSVFCAKIYIFDPSV